MESNVLPVGGLVYVTCYGPCWGLKGIIRDIDVIVIDDAKDDSLYFYLVALQDVGIKEPVWFTHDDVAEVEGHQASRWLPSREKPCDFPLTLAVLGQVIHQKANGIISFTEGIWVERVGL